MIKQIRLWQMEIWKKKEKQQKPNKYMHGAVTCTGILRET